MNISVSDPFVIRFRAYLNERFPLTGFLPLIIIFSFSLDYLGQLLSAQTFVFFDWQLLVGMLVLTLIFFHLRLFDEFKDYESDLQHHPERLVQQGIIQLSEIRLWLIIVILLETLGALTLGPETFYTYLTVLIFSLLMFKEFFIGPILNKNMVIYALTHQAIMLLIAAFLLSIHGGIVFLDYPSLLFWLSLAIMCTSFAFELSRKVHDPKDKNFTGSAYSKYFGWPRLSLVTMILIMLGSTAIGIVYSLLALPVICWYINAVIAIFCSWLIIKTGKEPRSEAVRRFMNWTSVNMLALYLLLAIAIIIIKV